MLIGCDSDDPEENTPEETARSERKQKIEQKIQELCSNYNAVTDWLESRPKYTTPKYTIEVEDALIRTDGRPVLFFASVEDIVRNSDKYTLYLCGGDRLTDLLVSLATGTGVERYAFVAQIQDVRKVKFELKAYANSPEEVYIELEPSSNVFIAKGKCLDLLPVGDYTPSTSRGNQDYELAHFILESLSPDIHFILECTPKQVEKIMLDQSDPNEAPLVTQAKVSLP